MLRCTGIGDGCNNQGSCENDFAPAQCLITNADGNLTETDAAEGLCENLQDDCIEAFHSCPHNGMSLQVDSTGVVIAEDQTRHNKIIFAKCVCTNAYSGNDCTLPPLPPPTIEPWKDPYAAQGGDEEAAAEGEGSAASVGGRHSSSWFGRALAIAAVGSMWLSNGHQ